MEYKLLCFDIDGTLLDDQKRISDSVKRSLRKASDMGIRIALASGRMPAGVEMIEKELTIDCIKICNAGTYILVDGNCIDSKYLSLDSMKNIYENIAAKKNIPLWIFREKAWYVTGIDWIVEREMQIIPYIPEVVAMDELIKRWQGEGKLPNKLLFGGKPELIQMIHEEMKDGAAWPDVEMAYSADTFIEIFPKGVDKGKALMTVCNHLGIDLQNVMAFGDQDLDIPLIEAAGTGVAMGNAIPQLKEKADFITGTNNEDGIAYALEHYLK
ncbi:MAG: Cof-type HAD-IIB family hydrolase [Lachnospiraceae bacterium]|nr:Cof-type HAD-IIB family hydrolase [Lachnospiraceae bacterium]